MNILDLETQNKCLLSKWLFKLVNENGVWQQLLKNKYLGSKTLSQVEKQPGDSHFWSGLMKVKQHFLQWTQFKVLNGKQVCFWEDNWLGNTALKDQYPNLYYLAHRKHDTVHKVLGGDLANICFRRNLINNNRRDWLDLLTRTVNIDTGWP